MTRVRVVSLRSFDPVIDDLSPRAFRAWQRALDFCDFHGTDGTLSPNNIKTVGASPAQQKELREAGLWEVDESGHTIVCELRYGPAVANVEGCEVEQLDTRKPASIRQARWREKNKRLPASTQASTVDVDSASTECLPKASTEVDGGSSNSPAPPPISSPSGSSLLFPESSHATSSDPKDLSGSARVGRKKPKVPLPDGWVPKQRHVEKALERRLDLGVETQRFRNDALKKDQRWADWDRAFDNWLISPFAKPEGAPSNGGRTTRAGDLTESLLQRAAMLRSQGQ